MNTVRKAETGMKKLRRFIGPVIDTAASLAIYAILAIAVLVVIGQAKRYYDMGYGIFSQVAKDAPGTGVKVLVEVTEGMTASEVGKMLEENGIVESARIFVIQEKVSEYSGEIKPGTYTLSSEMTTETIMSILSGTVVTEEDAARAAGEAAADGQ